VTGDMADFSIAKRAAELATSEFGQIDGLVINHGLLSPVTRIANSKVEEWKKSFDINFFSAIELVSSLRGGAYSSLLISTSQSRVCQRCVRAKAALSSPLPEHQPTPTAPGAPMEHPRLQ